MLVTLIMSVRITVAMFRIMLVVVIVLFVRMLVFVFVFFAHGFTIPSNEIRLIFACPHHSQRGVSTQPSGHSQVVHPTKLSYNASPLQG